MGIYSDMIANAVSIDTGGTDEYRAGVDKVTTRQLKALMARQGDLDYPSGYDALDEVQSIATHVDTVSGGTFTLAFTLWDGTTFTTADIAFDADAATIEAAIDTAADGTVANWTDGDIAVTGGHLNSAAVILTYNGDSVKSANHDAVVVDDALLTGDGSAGAVTTSTNGQSKRTAWAVLKACGAIAGDLPAQGATPSGLTAASNRHTNPHLPSQDTLRALAHEAAVQDKNSSVESTLLTAMGL